MSANRHREEHAYLLQQRMAREGVSSDADISTPLRLLELTRERIVERSVTGLMGQPKAVVEKYRRKIDAMQAEDFTVDPADQPDAAALSKEAKDAAVLRVCPSLKPVVHPAPPLRVTYSF